MLRAIQFSFLLVALASAFTYTFPKPYTAFLEKPVPMRVLLKRLSGLRKEYSSIVLERNSTFRRTTCAYEMHGEICGDIWVIRTDSPPATTRLLLAHFPCDFSLRQFVCFKNKTYSKYMKRPINLGANILAVSVENYCGIKPYFHKVFPGTVLTNATLSQDPCEYAEGHVCALWLLISYIH